MNKYERIKELIDKLNYETITESELSELQSLLSYFQNEISESYNI